MNCARIYNQSIGHRHAHVLNNRRAYANVYAQYIRPLRNWQTSLSLRAEDVLNGFFVYSLLLDKAERQNILILPHSASHQKVRLEPALAERNQSMEGIGQEHYPHACDLCCIMSSDEDGRTCMSQKLMIMWDRHKHC
jgi:hypothetical protein